MKRRIAGAVALAALLCLLAVGCSSKSEQTPPRIAATPKIPEWRPTFSIPEGALQAAIDSLYTPAPTVDLDSMLIQIPQDEVRISGGDSSPGKNAVKYDYIANLNTGKFHRPWCQAVDKMAEKNMWFFTGSRDELIGMGYDPCKICKP